MKTSAARLWKSLTGAAWRSGSVSQGSCLEYAGVLALRCGKERERKVNEILSRFTKFLMDAFFCSRLEFLGVNQDVIFQLRFPF